MSSNDGTTVGPAGTGPVGADGRADVLNSGAPAQPADPVPSDDDDVPSPDDVVMPPFAPPPATAGLGARKISGKKAKLKKVKSSVERPKVDPLAEANAAIKKMKDIEAKLDKFGDTRAQVSLLTDNMAKMATSLNAVIDLHSKLNKATGEGESCGEHQAPGAEVTPHSSAKALSERTSAKGSSVSDLFRSHASSATSAEPGLIRAFRDFVSLSSDRQKAKQFETQEAVEGKLPHITEMCKVMANLNEYLVHDAITLFLSHVADPSAAVTYAVDKFGISALDDEGRASHVKGLIRELFNAKPETLWTLDGTFSGAMWVKVREAVDLVELRQATNVYILMQAFVARYYQEAEPSTHTLRAALRCVLRAISSALSRRALPSEMKDLEAIYASYCAAWESTSTAPLKTQAPPDDASKKLSTATKELTAANKTAVKLTAEASEAKERSLHLEVELEAERSKYELVNTSLNAEKKKTSKLEKDSKDLEKRLAALKKTVDDQKAELAKLKASE